MKVRSWIAMVVASTMLFVPTAIAATAPPMVTPLNCVSSGMNPRVVATIAPNLSSPRVFFRANAERTEYYVDMRRGNGTNEWVGILPMIEPSTKTVTYRVAAVDENRNWLVSNAVTINTKSSCAGALASLATADQRMANNIVLGLTSAGQSEVPPGFSCRGIVSVIDYDCKMHPADGCRRLLALGTTGVVAKGAAVAAIAAGSAAGVGAGLGLGAAALAGLAAAGLAAGFAIYNSTSGGSGTNAESPSRP